MALLKSVDLHWLLFVRAPSGKMLGMGTQIGSRLKQGIIVLQIEMV